MVLQYYVVENATGKQIEIDIESATNEDLTSTKEKWQSDWTSEFIRDPKLEKYGSMTVRRSGIEMLCLMQSGMVTAKALPRK